MNLETNPEKIIMESIKEALKAYRYQQIGYAVAERLKDRHNRDIVNDDEEFKKFIKNHKESKEKHEQGLHDVINGRSQEVEISIEIKSKKHHISLLQREVENMVKEMIEFRFNPEPAILKVSNYEELGKKDKE